MPGFAIERDRFYTEYELREGGVLSEDVLKRGREKEGLRCKELKRGYRIYKGLWLLKWLHQQEGGKD